MEILELNPAAKVEKPVVEKSDLSSASLLKLLNDLEFYKMNATTTYSYANTIITGWAKTN